MDFYFQGMSWYGQTNKNLTLVNYEQLTIGVAVCSNTFVSDSASSCLTIKPRRIIMRIDRIDKKTGQRKTIFEGKIDKVNILPSKKYWDYSFDLTATLQDSPAVEVLLRRIAEFLSWVAKDLGLDTQDKKYLESLEKDLQARYFKCEHVCCNLEGCDNPHYHIN